MDRGGARMDADHDVWDWEVLPDHTSFSMGHGDKNLDDQETEEHSLPPSEDADVHDEPADDCKDIGVVPATETKSVPSVLSDMMLADEEEEDMKPFQSSDPKEAADDDKSAEEEEEDVIKKDKDGEARPECVVFSVGKLKVNGIGALCSFGVAAATVCIFLIGGKMQHQHRQQQQKIQLQFYGDDKRIQQVVQQTSRLNQAMSSVMGAGASTRANISFGGFYDGF
ncbi:hypothetical protein ACP70R_023237 [Stipagrostis hirtigluma subsp. patula]